MLDPYVWNVFPKSLAPTAIYLVVLAVGSYHLSAVIWTWLQRSSRRPQKLA